MILTMLERMKHPNNAVFLEKFQTSNRRDVEQNVVLVCL